jgi:dihydrofolate reductase
MRKIVAHLLMTLDGVVKFEDALLDTVKHLRGKEVEADFHARLAQEDAMLLGRVTYQEWAGFWPTSDCQPFADHINGVPKYVASRSLADVQWGDIGNATLLDGDFGDAIKDLKQQPGDNIGVHGSPTLVESLLHAGLLDELRLEIYPVLAGTGERFFRSGPSRRLRLASTNDTGKGVVILSYQPANEG